MVSIRPDERIGPYVIRTGTAKGCKRTRVILNGEWQDSFTSVAKARQWARDRVAAMTPPKPSAPAAEAPKARPSKRRDDNQLSFF